MEQEKKNPKGKFYQKKKIIICDKCQGEGKVVRPAQDCIDVSYVKIDCPQCLGSGKMRENTTIHITPFVAE